MSTVLKRRFGVTAALAMIVAEVLGAGIFLTPAGMARTLGDSGWVLAVWALVGLLSVAGALCYAELGTRFPEALGIPASWLFLPRSRRPDAPAASFATTRSNGSAP